MLVDIMTDCDSAAEHGCCDVSQVHLIFALATASFASRASRFMYQLEDATTVRDVFPLMLSERKI